MRKVDVVIVGSVALDSVKTPFAEGDNVLGGAGTYASIASSLFSKTGLVGVVGTDFPKEYRALLKKKKIDLSGLDVQEGKTFHWKGYYEYDMNQAHTIDTHLNVFETFNPVLPDHFRKAEYLFLGNLDPELQMKVLAQMDRRPKFVISDTMNFWISRKKEKVLEVVDAVDLALMNDAEARQLFDTPNLFRAARGILKLHSKYAMIKKGEHGAILFSDHTYFAVPGFPLENVIDPTGAGDSFAGTLIGYLAKTEDLSEKNMRKAMVYASSVASYNAEGFNVSRIKEITRADVKARYKEFKKIVKF